MPSVNFVTRALVVLLCIVVAGCGSGNESAPAAVEEPEYEGLSRDEMERQAESMTPEEAERLGIVDSTIRIEPPMNPDSVVPLDTQVIPMGNP